MKKIFILLIGLFFYQFSFSQNFRYEFSIESITNYGDAKISIVQVRDLMGVKSVKFLDDTDTFVVKTHLDFDLVELLEKFTINNVTIVGEILKTETE